MLPELVVIRGGGDIATGIAWRLSRPGWPIVVTELAEPLTVRRTVALSSAVADGTVSVEGMVGSRCTIDEALAVAGTGRVAVVVSPDLPDVDADVVVDARLAKRNIDTSIDDAPLVIGVGPGFEAGVDCHAVVETKRGHHLGRVFWTGSPADNTGTPGIVDGRGRERVLRAPTDGVVRWNCGIGALVSEDEPIGTVGHEVVVAPFAGIVRGLIAPGASVHSGLKIGDVDPRIDPNACHEISDKALAVGGGVLEAVLTWHGS